MSTSGVGRYDTDQDVTCPECGWEGTAEVRWDSDSYAPGMWDCPACGRTDNEEEPDGYDD